MNKIHIKSSTIHVETFVHSFDISSLIRFDILFSCAETEKLASFLETLKQCRLKTILDPWTNFVYVLQLLKHNILDLNKHKYGPFLSLNLVNFKMDPWHMPCLPPPRAGTALNAEEPTQIPLLFT